MELFHVLDAEGRGYLTKESFHDVCKDLDIDDAQLDSVFSVLDLDGDDRINAEDFSVAHRRFLTLFSMECDDMVASCVDDHVILSESSWVTGLSGSQVTEGDVTSRMSEHMRSRKTAPARSQVTGQAVSRMTKQVTLRTTRQVTSQATEHVKSPMTSPVNAASRVTEYVRSRSTSSTRSTQQSKDDCIQAWKDFSNDLDTDLYLLMSKRSVGRDLCTDISLAVLQVSG